MSKVPEDRSWLYSRSVKPTPTSTRKLRVIHRRRARPSVDLPKRVFSDSLNIV